VRAVDVEVTSITRSSEVMSSQPRPAYDSMLVDREGYLWVREFEVPRSDMTRRQWSVFDPGVDGS
jgi:hypothetical protein